MTRECFSAIYIATVTLAAPVEAKVIKWNCTYSIVSTDKGVAPQKDFRMLFALDEVTGKATLIGNMGVVDVTPVSGERAITFLERLSSGAVQATTIDASGRSVHSRHTIFGDKLMPSQSYGSCVNE